jgi:hypothetical protein
LECLDLFLFGTLVVVAFTELLDGCLELLLFLADIYIVTLQVLVLLLGEDTVQLHVQVLYHLVQVVLCFLIVLVAFSIFNILIILFYSLAETQARVVHLGRVPFSVHVDL